MSDFFGEKREKQGVIKLRDDKNCCQKLMDIRESSGKGDF